MYFGGIRSKWFLYHKEVVICRKLKEFMIRLQYLRTINRDSDTEPKIDFI